MLQVVDEKAEIQHMCRFAVRIGFRVIRTFFELREEMEKNVSLDLNWSAMIFE